MEMIKVKTTGDFMLFDTGSNKELVPDEYREVPMTHFVTERLESGQLKASGAARDVPLQTTGEERPAEGESAETKTDPLDHDGDGRKGGSKPKAARK